MQHLLTKPINDELIKNNGRDNNMYSTVESTLQKAIDISVEYFTLEHM